MVCTTLEAATSTRSPDPLSSVILQLDQTLDFWSWAPGPLCNRGGEPDVTKGAVPGAFGPSGGGCRLAMSRHPL